LNKQGVRTDYRGYAIVPDLQSYRYNNIQLDPSTLNNNVELGLTQLRKVPTQGAVVLAEYQTQVGSKAYLHITADGQDLPLGKVVKSTSGATGIVDDQGMAWITGLADEDTIHVSLADRQCEAKFNVSRFVLTDGVLQGKLQCK
jgi:P pilus assembly protein, porin PapC